MRRICMFALLLSALCVPAFADPLAITPEPYNSSGLPDAPAQPAPPAPRAPSAAAFRVAAAQPDLGGGFIQFLFGGEQPSTVPVAAEPPPSPPTAAPQKSALAGEPAGSEPAAAAGEEEESPPLNPKYDRQVVAYDGKEKPGTIVVDTEHKFLYLVEDGGKALRYGVGVGREGFTWSGVTTITAKREWPNWRPPDAMIKRQPYLPRFMAGGPDNPLGARALYLGSSEYRIHGSNEPWTIGTNVSSGCIRLRNADVKDLYNRVKVGTKVVVM